MEDKQVNWKRVIIYVLFAYGIAWLIGLVIYLRGGLANSPEIAPGISEALILLATGYMSAPAIAHILTRAVTREGWSNTFLKPKLKTGWPYWLAAWFGTAALLLLSAVLYFLIFPQYFDPTMANAQDFIAQQEAALGQQPLNISPVQFAALQVIMGTLVSPIANAIPVLGEEFGWRAYLQPQLMPLGKRKAWILTGLIWGFWHAPIIAMGHNYGLDYPGAPWTGIFVFTIVPVMYSIYLGWATCNAGSVWPAVIGHAVLNGLAAAVIFFVVGTPNPLLGPNAAGLLGSLGFTLAAILILLRPGKDRLPETAE